MLYIRVLWLHNFPNEPVELYSEIDDDRWEVRKVEIFRDKSPSYASIHKNTGSSKLGEVPFPALEIIALDPQFQPAEITREAFESIWSDATA